MSELLRTFHIKTLDCTKLRDCSIDISEGEAVLLFGNYGSGKEQIRDIIIGRLSEYEGVIFWDEKLCAPYNEIEARREYGIYYLNVEENLIDSLSVADNLFFVRDKKYGRIPPKKAINQECKDLLGELGLNISPWEKVSDLSYYEKIMVSFAKAISYRSRLIVFDYPMKHLSYHEINELKRLFLRYKDKKMSFLFMEEKQNRDILSFVDRIMIIKEGREKKVLVRNQTDSYELQSYLMGPELEAYRSIDKNYPDTITKKLKWEKETITSLENFHELLIESPLGVYDAQWGESENALEYFISFLYKNHWTLTLHSEVEEQINNINKALKQRKIVYIGADDYQKLILDGDVRKNLIIPKSKRELFSLIHNKKETFMMEELYSTFPILRNKTICSERLERKIVSIFRWERFRPQLLVVDTPEMGLNSMEMIILSKYLNSLVKRGSAVIVLSRQLCNLQAFCDQILCVMDKTYKGVLEQSGFEENELFFSKEIKMFPK